MHIVQKLIPPPAWSLLRQGKASASKKLRQTAARFGPGSLYLNRVASIGDPEICVSDYRCLAPPETHTFARQREYLDSSTFFRGGIYHRKEAFSCTLEHAKLSVDTGVIATEQNILVTDSAMELGRLTEMRVYGTRVPRKCISVGLASSIWHGWCNNYYHWVVDCLPRLYALQQASPELISLIVPLELRPFQARSLALLRPDNVRLLCLPSTAWVNADKLLFPSFVTWKANGYIPEPHLNWLRQKAFAGLHLSEHRACRRIYISRRWANRRRILNESGVISMLAKYGFEEHMLEDYSFEEQVRLFHSAETVVAPHGAGLSNIIFSGRINVIDLLPSKVPATHFFFLAESLGQRYSYLMADSSPEGDYNVDIEALKRLVESLNL